MLWLIPIVTLTGLVLSQLPSDPELANAYVALGTLVLAGVTALVAFLTWISIKQGVDKERRHKSENILSDVRAWAEEAARAAINRQTRIQHELWETKLEYRFSIATSPYIKRIGEPFTNLTLFLSGAITKLEQAEQVTMAVIERKADGARLIECENELRQSIETLLVEVASTYAES